MDSLLNELRRRNVLRLAATYALIAWILIEAGSVLLPTFGVPDWFFRAYVLVIFAGFAVALVLAWIFELTPDGIKLDSEVDHTLEPPRARGKSNAIIIALLVVALGVSITFNLTGIRHAEEAQIAAAGPASIAVLPFTSRSSDPDNQYFADGIQDDLLTRLAEIESLRVISRTSVNEYRNTSKNLREIGAELDVTTVVEGAVQRSGDQVRITVQLIDAATDEHLWANTYDRALTTENLFHIQSEISSQIATALRAALSPAEEIRLAIIPTKSLEALSLYSAARNNLYLRSFETLREARRQFERAIELDPEYAQAYAGLAETILVTENNHRGSIGFVEATRLAGEALDRALAIDDRLAEAHAVKGLMQSQKWRFSRVGDGNLEAAASFERAIDLNPNLANAYIWFSAVRMFEGSHGDAIELLTTAMQIDPLGRVPYLTLPNLYAARGEHDKALRIILKSMDIFPDWASAYASMAEHLVSLGRFDEAVAWTAEARSMTSDPMVGMGTVRVYIEFGDKDRIDAFARSFPADHSLAPLGIGMGHLMNNEFGQAVDVLSSLDPKSKVTSEYAYPLLSMAAMSMGDYKTAEEYLIRANPLLAADAENSVDRFNLNQAIKLAYVLRQQQKDHRASDLLAEAWSVIREMPRLGWGGYGIADVHILAIQGRTDAAIEALRNAVDEGFVSLMAFDYWTIDQDVMIDNLRDDPRFEALRLEMDRKLELMRENVRRADDSGDWGELLGRVRGDLIASLSGI